MFVLNTHLRNYRMLLSACTAACLLAACATTGHQSLRASAARLNDASNQFSAQIRYQGDDSHRGILSRDAAAMAKAASDLNHALSKGNTRVEVESEYRRVTDSYQQLHTQLADEGYAEQNRKVLADFDRVTTEYRSVESAMGVKPRT